MGPLRTIGEAWKGGLQGRTSQYPLSWSVPPGQNLMNLFLKYYCLEENENMGLSCFSKLTRNTMYLSFQYHVPWQAYVLTILRPRKIKSLNSSFGWPCGLDRVSQEWVMRRLDRLFLISKQESKYFKCFKCKTEIYCFTSDSVENTVLCSFITPFRIQWAISNNGFRSDSLYEKKIGEDLVFNNALPKSLTINTSRVSKGKTKIS